MGDKYQPKVYSPEELTAEALLLQEMSEVEADAEAADKAEPKPKEA